MTKGSGGQYILPRLAWTPTLNRYAGRSGATVRLVVLHDTEGAYSGSVAWLRDPKSQASAHVVIREDGNAASQLVAWRDTAWACATYNPVSDNIEMAGVEANGYSSDLWHTAARAVAARLKARGLPCHWVREPLLGHSGFCRHYDLGVAGGNHNDPTTDEQIWLQFCAMVKHEFDRGGFRPWGR